MKKEVFPSHLDGVACMAELSLTMIQDLYDSGYTINQLHPYISVAEIGINHLHDSPLILISGYHRLTDSVIREFKGDIIMWLK